MADEDLFRYLWAGAILWGVLVLAFYAISGWRFLRTMREDDEVNYQSPTVRPNVWRVK